MGPRAKIIAMVVLASALLLAVLPAPAIASGNGPSLTVVNPTPGLITKATTLRINGTTDGTSVTVNGLNADKTGKNFSLQVALAEGPNTFLLVASDAQGNTTAQSVTVVRDTTAPVVVVTSPTFPLVTNKKALHIAGTVETGCTILVNGTAATVAGSTFSADLVLNSNITNISVKATDLAGNERALTFLVKYDVTVSLVYRVNFGTWKLNETESKDEIWVYDDVVTVKGTTDPGSTVTIDGRPATVTPNGTFEGNARLKVGRNNISVKTTDPAGNNATGYLNIKKLEPFTVPVELAGGLLIIGLCAGTIGGYFIGRSKERKVQAKAKQKAAEAARAALRPPKSPAPAQPAKAPTPSQNIPRSQAPKPSSNEKEDIE